jgi:hypothetical protein
MKLFIECDYFIQDLFHSTPYVPERINSWNCPKSNFLNFDRIYKKNIKIYDIKLLSLDVS